MDEKKLIEIKALMLSEDWANLVSINEQENGVEFEMYVPASLTHFKGHFPDQPVLPGVVQTHWACELGRRVFDINTEFSGMDNIKFLSVILPEKPLNLLLEYKAEKNVLSFKYYSSDDKYSEGRIRFNG